jgi:hypothetical protein
VRKDGALTLRRYGLSAERKHRILERHAAQAQRIAAAYICVWGQVADAVAQFPHAARGKPCGGGDPRVPGGARAEVVFANIKCGGGWCGWSTGEGGEVEVEFLHVVGGYDRAREVVCEHEARDLRSGWMMAMVG